MGRKVVAVVTAGIAVFIWGAFSHMVLPIGEMGLQSLPNEEIIVPVLSAQLPAPGLYMYPAMGLGDDATPEEVAKWEANYQAGPRGLILFNSGEAEVFSASQMLIEVVNDILGAALLLILLGGIPGGAGVKVLTGALAGFFAWVSISLPYWNWYGFPAPFILAEGIDQIIGWSIAALILAILAGQKKWDSDYAMGITGGHAGNLTG